MLVESKKNVHSEYSLCSWHSVKKSPIKQASNSGTTGICATCNTGIRVLHRNQCSAQHWNKGFTQDPVQPATLEQELYNRNLCSLQHWNKNFTTGTCAACNTGTRVVHRNVCSLQHWNKGFTQDPVQSATLEQGFYIGTCAACNTGTRVLHGTRLIDWWFLYAVSAAHSHIHGKNCFVFYSDSTFKQYLNTQSICANRHLRNKNSRY